MNKAIVQMFPQMIHLILIMPELYGVVPLQNPIQQENATATIQQETDAVQNLRNIDYFMNLLQRIQCHLLFLSYNVNFDFMMTPRL